MPTYILSRTHALGPDGNQPEIVAQLIKQAFVAPERERPVVLGESIEGAPAHSAYGLGRCLSPTSNSLIISAIRSARLAGLRLVASIQLR